MFTRNAHYILRSSLAYCMITPKYRLRHEKMEVIGTTETGRRVYKALLADYIK